MPVIAQQRPRIWKWRTAWGLAACWLLAIFGGEGSPVVAQQTPLKLSIRREWEGARSCAPVSLRVFAGWSDPRLLEGRLRVEGFLEQQSMGGWTGPETALAGSEQHFWFMLPSPMLRYTGERYILKTEFLSPQQSFPVEELDIEAWEYNRRDFVVAAVVSQPGAIPVGIGSNLDRVAYEQPLTLQQRLAPEDASALFVHNTRIKYTDLPSDSLRYLGLDALIVAHDTLNLLKPDQRAAIQKWVLAGGNLLLLQTGPLQRDAELLVRSLSRNDYTLIRRRDPRWPAGMQVFAPGLGRFFHTVNALSGESEGWKVVAWDLLRLHGSSRHSLNAGGRMQLPWEELRSPSTLVQTVNSPWSDPSPRSTTQPLRPLPRINVDELTPQMMPQEIRGMPFGLAAGVLAACVLCIGPADFFLLGLIRRRRWTWVMFPLITLGFTAWMAQLAAEHNGQNDTRCWVSIVDITPENEVLRTTRIELNYGSSSRHVVHDVRSQWWTDLRQDDLGWAQGQQHGFYNPYEPRSYPDLGPRLTYEGAVPANYKVLEPVRQWAPRLQRITTLGADPALEQYPLPRADWRRLEKPTADDLLPAITAMENDFPDASWCLDRRKDFQTTAWASLRKSETPSPGGGREAAILTLIQNLTSFPKPSPGVFALITELAPTASPECEDLCLTSQPSLIVVQEVEPGRFLATRVIYPPRERN